MQNLNIYEANYGDSREILFLVFKKYFLTKNKQKIGEIFQDILQQKSKENNLSEDEYLNQIDDDFISQIMVGILDNINSIDNILQEYGGQKFEFNFQIILKLIIFELQYLPENSSQKIFLEYQEICKKYSIKFDDKMVINLIKTLREFEN
jgi:transcription termination factor NusB